MTGPSCLPGRPLSSLFGTRCRRPARVHCLTSLRHLPLATLRAGGSVHSISLVTFFAAAKKVGAAPHRGSANRPTRKRDPAKVHPDSQTRRRPHHLGHSSSSSLKS